MNYRKMTALLCVGALFSLPLQAKNDKHSDLPPGLQKKVQKGKPLPPGWQKKLKVGERLDRRVYEQSVVIVPKDRNGLMTIRVEGKVIRLVAATMEIVNILNE